MNPKIEIDITEFEKYQQVLELAQRELINFEERFLNTLANLVMEYAIPRTPVDTGRLRRSYKVSSVTRRGNDLTIVVYNDAREDGAGESYASYVEFGHFTRNRVTYVEGVRMITLATDEVLNEMHLVWNMLFNQFVKEVGL